MSSATKKTKKKYRSVTKDGSVHQLDIIANELHLFGDSGRNHLTIRTAARQNSVDVISIFLNFLFGLVQW